MEFSLKNVGKHKENKNKEHIYPDKTWTYTH